MAERASFSAVIIGGGPAGLFCALRAAGEGRRILLLEKKPSPGRKLLLAGSGQCNLTQAGDIGAFLAHYGDNGAFLKPALRSFGNQDLISFFEERGVVMVAEPDGKVFPKSRQAADILEALLAASSKAKVKVRNGEPVTGISRADGAFRIRTSCTTLSAERVVIATGGITYPGTGSTGDGYRLAGELGHRVVEPGPALCAVQIKDQPFAELAGVSFPGRTVTLIRDGRSIRRHSGDILFTHGGLSGPGIINFSRFIRAGDVLSVSFLSGLSPEAADKALLGKIAASGQRLLATILAEFDLPERFVKKLLAAAGLNPDLTGAHLSKPGRASLLKLLTGWPLVVGKLGGVHEAMATRGGIALEEVNPKTMESRLVPGLLFAGEVLDIDGDTGGYNLQAAFSTAALAARRITGD